MQTSCGFMKTVTMILSYKICKLLAFTLFMCCIRGHSNDSAAIQEIPADTSYKAMKEAYYDENWETCVEQGLLAITLLNKHMYKLVSCRENCKTASKFDSVDAVLSGYGGALFQATCINRCKPSNPKFLSNYIKKEPYDFLQICYYKVSRHCNCKHFRIVVIIVAIVCGILRRAVVL